MTTTKLTLALSAAAAAGLLAVGGAVAFAATVPAGPTVRLAAAEDTHATGDALVAKECAQASPGVPDKAGWRPGARIDLSSELGFLVIRNDRNAAVCVIERGRAAGVMGGEVSSRHTYGKLTAARPFDYLDSWNTDNLSVHFGIATNHVTAVSLVGPDRSVTPGSVKDGTFIVKTRWAESSSQPTTNQVRATLDNGQVVTGPFRG